MKPICISCCVLFHFQITSSLKPSVLSKFSPPGNLQDFTPKIEDTWSQQYIENWMQGEIDANDSIVSPGRTKLTQYFNGLSTAFDQSQEPAMITWIAFPNLKFGRNEPLRWQVADSSRDFQDEYLEWSVKRDQKNNILSVTYTSEGPEYWDVLASYQRDDAFKLAKALNAPLSSRMQEGDLFLTDPGTGRQVYNPKNPWNERATSGTILHLVHPSNTLGAEIDIAAQATVIRKDSRGMVITDAQQLIKCSQYGNPGRNSDPAIGININALAQQGNSIMVANPVALYIHQFDTAGFLLDTGGTSDPADPDDLVPLPDNVFKWQRGDITKKQGLRLQVSVPDGVKGKDGQQLNVSNIWDRGRKRHIKYGAQFADYITMSVSAVAINSAVADPIPCYSDSKVTGRAAGALRNGSAELAAAEAVAEGGVFPYLTDSAIEVS